MKKGAMLKKNYELVLFGIIFLSVLSFLIYFVSAKDFQVTTPTGLKSYTVNEDQAFTFNFTINNTIPGVNVTILNITIDSTFAFKTGSNGTSASANIQEGNINITFTNTSTVLRWVNTSAIILSYTNQTFWFNATPSTPGVSYTFTILSANASEVLNTTIFTIIVSEIHNVMGIDGTRDFGNIKEDQQNFFNITLNNTLDASTGNITNITITFPSTFYFTASSHGYSNSSAVGGKMNITFTNTSTSLTWLNSTASGLITNAANASIWFNLSAQTPGNYNITVTTVNSQDAGVHIQNFTITIIKVHNVMTTGGILNFSTINEDTQAFFNITLNSTVPIKLGNITNITITFPSTFNFTASSNGYSFNTNGTNVAGATFSNTSTSITWKNNSNGIVTDAINGSVWFNLSAQTPGNYVITLITVNSQDNGTHIQNFTVSVRDITDPETPVYNCTKLTGISEGETAPTCSCTAADNYDSATTISYETPVTTNAGTYTITCTATDDSTYNSSVSLSYTVDTSGGNVISGTSGGGGTTYTNTFVEDTYEFSEVEEVSKELGAKNRIRIKINNLKHEIGVTALTATTATIEVSSTPQTAILSVGDTRKFDVTNDGYYDLSVTLDRIVNSKASITLKSIYEKVTTETVVQEQEKQAAAEEQTQPETTGTLQETSSNTMIWVVGVIIVILILVGISYLIKKKKRR